MRRGLAIFTMLSAITGTALAQGVPPILIPAPPAPTMPPLVAPTPVPSAVTPLPTPSYGVPRGITSTPSYGSGITPTVRYQQPAKPRKTKRRPRISSGSR